jgi:hypothetical protein
MQATNFADQRHLQDREVLQLDNDSLSGAP